jgi:Zn-dependent alcohol dehydrogenase
MSTGCTLIQQSSIKVGTRDAFFEGTAVAAATPAQKSQLTQVSVDCASHLNSLRNTANNVYATKNIVTSLGLLGGAVGGGIAAYDAKSGTNNTTAVAVTTISGVGVAALAQIVTTTLVDPVATKDKFTNAFKYWSDAQDDVNASNFGATIDALRNCASDAPYPVKQAPAGVQITPNTAPVP